MIFAESAKELGNMNKLDNESKKVGLNMNPSKTKVVTNSRRISIFVTGKVIKYVSE